MDSKRTTQDSRVFENFEQESMQDTNIDNHDYCGTIQKILEFQLVTSKICILDVKWLKVVC